MPKKISAKNIPKENYTQFKAKAQEFFETMSLNFIHGKYTAAASAGIHCAVLAADACLIYCCGIKCSSDRHLDIVPLIEGLLLKDAKRAASHLAKILEVKSLVEYTGDRYTIEESQQILTRVERFFGWTKSVLPH